MNFPFSKQMRWVGHMSMRLCGSSWGEFLASWGTQLRCTTWVEPLFYINRGSQSPGAMMSRTMWPGRELLAFPLLSTAARKRQMRAIIQRVSSASVTGQFPLLLPQNSLWNFLWNAVDNEVVSRISEGLMVLVGIGVGQSYRHFCCFQKRLTSSFLQNRWHRCWCCIAI